jgi:hypothetical protein
VDELRNRWQEFLAIPYPRADYPPGSPVGEVDGVDLALLDGDAAAIVSSVVDREGPHDGADTRLVLEDLERVVPQLTAPGRAYFEPLLELVRLAQYLTGDPPSSPSS